MNHNQLMFQMDQSRELLNKQRKPPHIPQPTCSACSACSACAVEQELEQKRTTIPYERPFSKEMLFALAREKRRADFVRALQKNKKKVIKQKNAKKYFDDNFIIVTENHQEFFCTICQDNHTNDKIVKKNTCSHSFHEICIMDNLIVNTDCPLCRI